MKSEDKERSLKLTPLNAKPSRSLISTRSLRLISERPRNDEGDAQVPKATGEAGPTMGEVGDDEVSRQ